MKILHTSDWHLGQKFIAREREEEHRLALDWLIETIQKEKVDLLLIAGDVFDIGNPPNASRLMYYNFFKKLRQTNCRHVVVTGGNHDSPQMLNAPKELLQLLDIHVIGCPTGDISSEIIVLKNEKGEPECVVAAVPFLRDQDLKKGISGETGQERVRRIQEGILQHYREAAQATEPYQKMKIPLIATGHLYATGAQTSDKQDNIYLGNLENIRAEDFPSAFDYVALGHIHRAQAVGGLKHVRYCGSLIPLSFSETKDDKSVVLLEFQGKKCKRLDEIRVPLFRRLKSIEGSFAEVQERLETLDQRHRDELPPWVEVTVNADANIPNLDGFLHDFVRNKHLELLRIRLKKPHFSLDQQVQDQELGDLKPIEVFQKRCDSAGNSPEQAEGLMQTFRELEEWMRGREV